MLRAMPTRALSLREPRKKLRSEAHVAIGFLQPPNLMDAAVVSMSSWAAEWGELRAICPRALQPDLPTLLSAHSFTVAPEVVSNPHGDVTNAR
jgi:hypothetical protein